ncbi:MAG: hypothetical protein N3A58_00885 [Spirochaetes bacterium]|nr:hypothetical protein [Spirochaetota bacterium]
MIKKISEKRKSKSIFLKDNKKHFRIENNKINKIRIIDNLFLIIILLSIIQIIIENLSFILGLKISLRNLIILSGAFFDIIFSIEFIIKSLINIKNRKFKEYFFYNNGWIDFFASIPVFIFSSLPALIEIYYTSNIFNIRIFKFLYLLRSVKIIRTSRVIRILRVLKLLGKIENLNSVMLQKNINFVSIIVTNSILLGFLVTKIILPYDFDRIEKEFKNNIENKIKAYFEIEINKVGKNYDEDSQNKLIQTIFSSENCVSAIKYKDKEIYRKFDASYINEYIGKNNMFYISIKDYNFEIILYEFIKYKNSENLMVLIIVLINVLTIIFLYTKRFSTTVSDPVYLLYKGIRDPNYFLMIKIPEKYKNEEIFEFAKFFNERYLPAKYKLYIKNKESLKEKQSSSIKLDDLDKLL